MKKTYKQCWSVLIALFIISLIILKTPTITAEETDSLKILDFSDEQQSNGFYVDLDGKWEFYEKELLTPDEVNNREGRIVSLPNSFEAQTGEINSFGTYSTSIKIPKEYVGETLAIHIPF